MKLNMHVWRMSAVAALFAMAVGTGLVAPVAAADGGLVHTKTVTPEGDDYRISLTANSRHWPTIKPVDVVVLLDHSGSMFSYLNRDTEEWTEKEDPNDPTRWAVLSQDLRDFGNVLFNEMNRSSVITFYAESTLHKFPDGSMWTNDKQEWLDKTVNNFNRQTPSSNTNWVGALKQAMEPVRDMDPTHEHVVLFMTDGHFTRYTDDAGKIVSCEVPHQATNTKLRENKCFGMARENAKKLYEAQPDLQFISIGVGNNAEVLEDLHEQVTGSSKGYYPGTDEINLNDVFNRVTMSTISPLRIDDTLSQNVEFDGDIRVTDSSGDAVPGNQYEAGYDADSRSVKVVFNTRFNPVDGHTYTASFRVRPSQKAYDTLAALDGAYPDTGEPGTGETSAGLPGLFSNDSASVTYNDRDQGKLVTLDYPHPVIQVTLPSWTVRRTGDCPAATVTVHLFKDGEDTGLSAHLAPDGNDTFTDLLPGHSYELRADSAGETCTQPALDPGVFEPQSPDETLTSELNTDRIRAVVHYDPNGGKGTMPDVDGYVGDTVTAGQSEFTNDDECIQFAGWNTSADGTGTAYQPKDQLAPLTTEVTLYAQWRQQDGCPATPIQQEELPHTGVGVTTLVLGMTLLLLLGAGALTQHRLHSR